MDWKPIWYDLPLQNSENASRFIASLQNSTIQLKLLRQHCCAETPRMLQENMLCIKSIYINNTTASAAPMKLCLYYLANLAWLQHEAIAKKCMKGLYTLQTSCGSLCLNHLVDDYFAALASLLITSFLLKRQGK